MKAIIHIGMPKTGTTSIQTWLNLNREPLKVKEVHLIPTTMRRTALEDAIIFLASRGIGFDEYRAWQGLHDRLRNMACVIEENFKLLNAYLEKLSGQSGIFIYSLELLYRHNEVHMITLDKFLSRFFEEINYVVYIRDTVDFFVSLYSQKLRIFCPQYGSEELSRFLKRCERNSIPYEMESSFAHLFEWERIFGERLDVRLMESDWLINGDLIDDFASILGMDTFCAPDREKRSFAAEYIEYVRFLNLEFGQKLPIGIRKRALNILMAASAAKPKPVASDKQASLIHAIHREQEDRIRKKFFPGRTILYSPKARGEGVMPLPLTEYRKREIERELNEKMVPLAWNPYELSNSPASPPPPPSVKRRPISSG